MRIALLQDTGVPGDPAANLERLAMAARRSAAGVLQQGYAHVISLPAPGRRAGAADYRNDRPKRG